MQMRTQASIQMRTEASTPMRTQASIQTALEKRSQLVQELFS
jgi:hypothetical protein